MKISVPGRHPSLPELVDVLNKAFGPRYSFRLFGLGETRTIMARKSTFVGLQISFDNETVNFQRTLPTIASSAYSFLMMTELIAILILPLLIVSDGFTKDPYKEMAKEIGFFLKEKYAAPAQR